MAEPTLDRPVMPEGYGVPDTDEALIPWGDVEERLVSSQVYWLATTRRDGRPHVVPRWGAWLDGGLYYDGSPETVHVRNLAVNPACVLHLEDGTRAVIVEGSSGPTTAPPLDTRQRLSKAMRVKYGSSGYAPDPDSWTGPDAGGLCRFVPGKAMAWAEFPSDVTRYRFG